MTSISQNSSWKLHEKTRALGALLLVFGIGAVLGCETVPPVSQTLSPDAKFIRAESPIDWSSRTTGCSDARKRARSAARNQCLISQVTVRSDSCECRRGESQAASWRCSAEAAYTCSDEAEAQPLANRGL